MQQLHWSRLSEKKTVVTKPHLRQTYKDMSGATVADKILYSKASVTKPLTSQANMSQTQLSESQDFVHETFCEPSSLGYVGQGFVRKGCFTESCHMHESKALEWVVH